MKMRLKDWNIGSNELSILLIDYYVKISIKNDLGKLYYSLTVADTDMKELNLIFNSLEEAVNFTEDKIVHCDTYKEIIEFYKDYIIDKNKIEPDEKIFLTPDEVDQAIIDYYSEKKDNRLSVENTIEMSNYCPRINFYLVEHVNIDGNKHKAETLLTEYDLKNALAKYIDFYGYELIKFNYKGETSHSIHTIKNGITYEGLELQVKTKNKRLKK